MKIISRNKGCLIVRATEKRERWKSLTAVSGTPRTTTCVYGTAADRTRICIANIQLHLFRQLLETFFLLCF